MWSRSGLARFPSRPGCMAGACLDPDCQSAVWHSLSALCTAVLRVVCCRCCITDIPPSCVRVQPPCSPPGAIRLRQQSAQGPARPHAATTEAPRLPRALYLARRPRSRVLPSRAKHAGPISLRLRQGPHSRLAPRACGIPGPASDLAHLRLITAISLPRALPSSVASALLPATLPTRRETVDVIPLRHGICDQVPRGLGCRRRV